MPGRSGLDIAIAVKREVSRLNAIYDFEILRPFVMVVSAFVTPAFKRHLRKNHVDAVYEKPLLLCELAQIISPPAEEEEEN